MKLNFNTFYFNIPVRRLKEKKLPISYDFIDTKIQQQIQQQQILPEIIGTEAFNSNNIHHRHKM